MEADFKQFNDPVMVVSVNFTGTVPDDTAVDIIKMPGLVSPDEWYIVEREKAQRMLEIEEDFFGGPA